MLYYYPPNLVMMVVVGWGMYKYLTPLPLHFYTSLSTGVVLFILSIIFEIEREGREGYVGVHAHTRFSYDLALSSTLAFPSHFIFTMI